MEEDNWHLKEGAPAETVKEFNEFMQELNADKGSEENTIYESMANKINKALNDSLNY
jgi:hypothetical protein